MIDIFNVIDILTNVIDILTNVIVLCDQLIPLIHFVSLDGVSVPCDASVKNFGIVFNGSFEWSDQAKAVYDKVFASLRILLI